MNSVGLFDLVAKNREWLSARQSMIASNIANANTPGFSAKDASPFAQVLTRTGIEVAATDARHLRAGGFIATQEVAKESASWEVSHSGNSVSLEQEMMKLSDLRGAFALDASVLKAFHGMWMSSLKG